MRIAPFTFRFAPFRPLYFMDDMTDGVAKSFAVTIVHGKMKVRRSGTRCDVTRAESLFGFSPPCPHMTPQTHARKYSSENSQCHIRGFRHSGNADGEII